MADGPFSFGTAILAAGRSVRMGKPKLLLPWGETSILGHLIHQWQVAGARQVVVVCSDDRMVHDELDRLSFAPENVVENTHADEGMFSSVLCAARWRGWHASITHWAISLGDQPHLRGETLAKLLDFARTHRQQVCQPSQQGRLFHPVVLPRSVFTDLSTSMASTLKQFLATREVAGCECNDPGLSLDIDRPEDYEKALSVAGIAPSN